VSLPQRRPFLPRRPSPAPDIIWWSLAADGRGPHDDPNTAGSRTVEQAGDLEAATTADPSALLLVRPAAVATPDPAILTRYRQTSFVDPVTRALLTWLAPEES